MYNGATHVILPDLSHQIQTLPWLEPTSKCNSEIACGSSTSICLTFQSNLLFISCYCLNCVSLYSLALSSLITVHWSLNPNDLISAALSWARRLFWFFKIKQTRCIKRNASFLMYHWSFSINTLLSNILPIQLFSPWTWKSDNADEVNSIIYLVLVIHKWSSKYRIHWLCNHWHSSLSPAIEHFHETVIKTTKILFWNLHSFN